MSFPAPQPTPTTDEQSPKMEFAPVKARRVFEEIILQIRRELTLGNLRPGDKLPPERELAKQFGSSRTAVREALRTLENAGIILSRKGVRGGAFVREADSGMLTRLLGDLLNLGSISLASLTEARVHILAIVIDLACNNGSETQFTAMDEAVAIADSYTPRMSAELWQGAIVMFYEQLGLATGNAVLFMLVRSIAEIVRDILKELAPPPRKATVSTFRAIISALRERDAPRARELMQKHVMDVHQYLLEVRATLPARS